MTNCTATSPAKVPSLWWILHDEVLFQSCIVRFVITCQQGEPACDLPDNRLFRFVSHSSVDRSVPLIDRIAQPTNDPRCYWWMLRSGSDSWNITTLAHLTRVWGFATSYQTLLRGGQGNSGYSNTWLAGSHATLAQTAQRVDLLFIIQFPRSPIRETARLLNFVSADIMPMQKFGTAKYGFFGSNVEIGFTMKRWSARIFQLELINF